MTDDRPTPPPDLDATVPNVARMHEYLRGGTDHFPADAERAGEILAEFPAARAIIEANREFSAYGVEVAAAAGIGQYLDVGSGLPTPGSTHHVAARSAGPLARVVYVDLDPEVVTHSAVILGDTTGVAVLELDAADVAGILAAATDPARGTARLDLTRPICVIMTCVLHFVGRPPAEVMRDYLDALAPGSMLIVTHGTGDGAACTEAGAMYRIRPAAELEAAFAGWDLAPPGLARVEYFAHGGEVHDSVAEATGAPCYLGAVIATKPDL